MSVYDHPEFDNHEKVLFATDKESGLKAILAVHSTARGPAVGGCRMWTYESSAEALTDEFGYARADMDAYALTSQQRAGAAWLSSSRPLYVTFGLRKNLV